MGVKCHSTFKFVAFKNMCWFEVCGVLNFAAFKMHKQLWQISRRSDICGILMFVAKYVVSKHKKTRNNLECLRKARIGAKN